MNEQTTTQLTGEQWLAEIEARANAATAGPWCTDSWEIYQGTEYVPGISMWIGETCRGMTSMEQDRADAAFIAAARTDVPALVAEVRELLLHTRTLEALVAEQAAEIDRLRNELEPYEVLNPQQCPKGLHSDWLVDSENTHACPWCRIAELEYAATKCDFVACEPGGEPCSTHERLMAHAEGDHELCAPDCQTAKSDQGKPAAP
ncbi:hypothetical protein ACWGH4_00065 [Streptomyces sp. NPDC054847]